MTPVQSVVDENVPLKTKPFIGRGGAGNVRSISNERSSAERRSGNVVSVPGTEAGAQVEGEKIAEPEQAHLCEGREVVSGDDDRIV